jgi:ferritin-like protein
MHSEILAKTIIQLVWKPVIKFDQLIATLQCCYQQPSSDLTNLKQVVQDVLPAEACAIEFI